MENKKSQLDEVRCINKSGKVRFFRRYFAMDKNWQRATGFTPEELPKVVALDQIPPKVESLKATYKPTLAVDEIEGGANSLPEFSIDFTIGEEDDTDLSESKAPKPQPQTTAKATSQAAKPKQK